ncbi:MAG: ATP-binding cassette domain-containing protein [Pseudomonadota bacterium]
MDLTINGLVVRGGDGQKILAIDELAVPAASLIGVRGPSGAGKSTFLYALAGLLESAAGQIRWGDTDILDMSIDDRAAFRAASVGMVFQDFLLFDELDAATNAAVAALFAAKASRANLRARADKNLSRLGFAQSQRQVSSFSGGERQRVAVARALANDAAVLLADEPTASLPRDAADALIDDLVREAKTGAKTMIVVSHDPALMTRMDRILTIVDGRVESDDRQVAL